VSRLLRSFMVLVTFLALTAQGAQVQLSCKGFQGSRIDTNFKDPTEWTVGPDSYNGLEIRFTFPDKEAGGSLERDGLKVEWGQTSPFSANWTSTAIPVNMTSKWWSFIQPHETVTRLYSLYFPSNLPSHKEVYLAYAEHQTDLLGTGLPEIKQFQARCSTMGHGS
jgi:hypothetical protein